MPNPNIPQHQESEPTGRNETAQRVDEVLKLSETTEQMFDRIVRPRIHEIVEALRLASSIESSRNILSEPNGSPAQREKRAAENLMKGFFPKRSSFNQWAFFPEAVLNESGYDVTFAAMLFGVLMNVELGIKTEYAAEPRHAYDFVTLSNQDIYLLDPKNKEINQIHPGNPEIKGQCRIYHPNRPGQNNFFVSSVEHGYMMTMFKRMLDLQKASSSDDHAARVIQRYGKSLDFEQAERYLRQFGI